MKIRAATILPLLANKTIQFNTQVKKTEPGLQKQPKIDIKSATKFDFSLNIWIYSYILLIPGVFVFKFIIFKHLQTLNVCITMFL